MAQTVKIDHIVSQIELLDYDNKINILEKVLGMIKNSRGNDKSQSILNLKGLGKDIWTSIDVDDYLKTERESWE